MLLGGVGFTAESEKSFRACGESKRLKGFMKRKMLRFVASAGGSRSEGKKAKERNKKVRGDLIVKSHPVSSIILIIFQLTYN